MRIVRDEERRARLGALHFLQMDGVDPVEVTTALVSLHSSDPATVFLSLRARVPGFETRDLERALYEDRSLVRILGMRRTMWVVNADMGPVIHHSSTAALVGGEQRRLWKIVEEAGLASDGRSWVAETSRATLEALQELGSATAIELRREVPQLKEQVTVYKKDGGIAGTMGMSTRILFLLATEGRILRGRPRGTWLSSQYEWATYEHWLGHARPELDPFQAQQKTLGSWLSRFGPATEVDAKWWTGWPVTLVRKVLDTIGPEPVATSEGTGYLAPDDPGPPAVEPWVAFLPGLDPTVMGWKQRDWYVGGHAGAVFDRNGNAGPTIMIDGRVAGVWAQRPDGRVVWELLEKGLSGRQEQIEEKAEELQVWLSGHVVTPRFRTPLEKELASGGP